MKLEGGGEVGGAGRGGMGIAGGARGPAENKNKINPSD